MKSLIIERSKDGSDTLRIGESVETYHSIHGAVTESKHVFIEAGLEHVLDKQPSKKSIDILEIGFGTGLNCMLSLDYILESHPTIILNYTGLEPHPLSVEIIQKLNYSTFANYDAAKNDYMRMHLCECDTSIEITNNLLLTKAQTSLQDFEPPEKYDLVYYDAFAPNAQPELWTLDVFDKLFTTMRPDGVLVTYCAKGEVRRTLQNVGFSVERLPGPPGKREMLRATK